jgi:hypothetical protein
MTEVHTTDRMNTLERENAHLRIMAASVRCPYGHRDVSGSCELGYPGCACMDDLLALQSWCPEDEQKAVVRLGKRVAEAESQFTTAADELDRIADEMHALSTKLRYRLLPTEVEAQA